jgi:hypothetical protein
MKLSGKTIMSKKKKLVKLLEENIAALKRVKKFSNQFC